MPINTSINLVQNNANLLDQLKDYFDKQINPLANAGQRFGISANGIAYKSFSVNDIFNNVYDENQYIAELKYVNSNDIKISLIDKETYQETNYTIYKTNAISKNVYLSNKDEAGNNNDIVNLLAYVINNIETYKKDSLLINENGILTCILKGKYVNEDESKDGELFYFQYDIINNRLLHFINSKPYDGYINEINGWYILYKLDYADNDIYNLSIHLFTLDSLSKIIINAFNIDTQEAEITSYLRAIYKYSTPIFESDGQNNSHISRSFSPFNYIFKDYDLLTAQNTSNVFSDINLFQIVLNYNEEDYDQLFNDQINIIHFDNLVINYNLVNDEEYFTLNTDDTTGYKKVIGYLSNEDINDYLHIVLNIHFIYIKLLKYYNKLVYNENAETLYTRILISLFNALRKDANIDNYNDRLYIPLDYKIHYVCNDNDLLDVYYSNNIYITLINTTEFKMADIHNMILYYHPLCISHSVIYNFEFDYNKTYSDIIVDLRLVKLYSLPYINKLNNWVINDIDTNINSINDINSGIKTVFIYSDVDKFEILNISNLVNDNNAAILNKFTCDKKSFIVNPKLFTNYSNYRIQCNAWIPTINDYNKTFFEQTLIISVSSKDNFNSDEYSNDYNLDYVYSLWVMTETNGKLSFEYIKDLYSNNEYAYDPFNSTAFFQYLTNETNKVSALLVSSQNYKQTSSDVSNNCWLVTRNKNANNYNSTGYNNEYNTIIEYVNKLNKSGDNSNYSSTKFISDLGDIQVTNSIYPKIKFEVETVETTEEFKRLVTNLQSNFHYYEVIIVNGQTITTEETLQEIINQVQSIQKTQQTYSAIVETARVTSNNVTFYNEYVFNTNVPTLDLKELFVRNINILNRTNILSLSPDNKIYNGYIGTSFTNNDKSILHISGSNSNINIGTDTLLNANQFNKFNAYKTLSLDSFESINIDPSSKLILSKNPLIVKSNNEYVTSIIPFGSMHYQKIPFKIKVNTVDEINLAFSDQLIPSELSMNKNILFTRFYLSYYEDNETKEKDMFDCIYLNNLIYNAANENINSLTLNNFKKYNDNMIFMIPAQNVNHFFMILNSNELDISSSYLSEAVNHNIVINKYTVNELAEGVSKNITKYKIGFDDSNMNNVLYGTHITNFTSIKETYNDQFIIGVENEVNMTIEHIINRYKTSLSSLHLQDYINMLNYYVFINMGKSKYENDSYTTDNLTYQNITIN